MENNEVKNQTEIANELLLEMVKNQKTSNKNLIKVIIVLNICYALIIIFMIVGFFWYESQFEITDEVVEDTYTYQSVDGENSEINNVDGNMYKDNAVHNQN